MDRFDPAGTVARRHTAHSGVTRLVPRSGRFRFVPTLRYGRPSTVVGAPGRRTGHPSGDPSVATTRRVGSVADRSSIGPLSPGEDSVGRRLFTERFIAESHEVLHALRPADVDAVVDVIRRTRSAAAACSSADRAAAPGTPRTRRATSASSRASRPTRHRQRERADCSHQRRRLGDRVRELARGLAARSRRLRVRLLGRWRRRGARREREPRAGDAAGASDAVRR